MKGLVWIILFIIEVITGAIFICTGMLWMVNFPTKLNMGIPSLFSLCICILTFIINQYLMNKWDNKSD